MPSMTCFCFSCSSSSSLSVRDGGGDDVIVGFAMMGNLLFGPELWGYHDVSSAVSSTLRMALGELDYVPLANVNRSLAPVFTLLFVVLVFFVLINIFLAIINDAYSVIHAEAKKEQTSFLDDVTREVCHVTVFNKSHDLEFL